MKYFSSKDKFFKVAWLIYSKLQPIYENSILVKISIYHNKYGSNNGTQVWISINWVLKKKNGIWSRCYSDVFKINYSLKKSQILIIKKIQYRKELFHDVIILEFITELHHKIFSGNPRRNKLQRRTKFNKSHL